MIIAADFRGDKIGTIATDPCQEVIKGPCSLTINAQVGIVISMVALQAVNLGLIPSQSKSLRTKTCAKYFAISLNQFMLSQSY